MKRKLEFTRLDDAVNEANRLLTCGYHQTGNWDLAQTLTHCADWLRFPLEGYPEAKFPMNMIFAFVRMTMGKAFYRKVLRERGFKAGSPTFPATVKEKHAKSDADALREFSEVIEQFKSFRGQPHLSPLFGNLSYEEHLEIQLIHLQHHLRNLIPNDDAPSSSFSGHRA